jgi:hypothetical protein
MDLLLALMIIPTNKNYYHPFCLVPLIIQIGIELFPQKITSCKISIWLHTWFNHDRHCKTSFP